jgi:hypothetical protein
MGGMFSPPAVMMSSLMRPVTFINPEGEGICTTHRRYDENIMNKNNGEVYGVFDLRLCT